MGLDRVERVVAGLLAAGLPAGTPAAAISRGTFPDQETRRTTLADLASAADGLAGAGAAHHRRGRGASAASRCCAARRRCRRSSASAAAGALVAGAEAAQQLDLDRVHRVDVRVADPDRAADDRVALEQRSSPTIASTAETVRSCSASISPQSRSGSSSAGTSSRYSRAHLGARLRERHLEVVDQRAEERQLAVQAAQAFEVGAGERGAAAVPGREQRAVLRPGEDPRDRAQRAEVVAALGPRAGREPRSSSASSSTGVNARKKSTKPGVCQTSDRYCASERGGELVEERPLVRLRRAAGGRGRRSAPCPRAPTRGCGRPSRAGRT